MLERLADYDDALMEELIDEIEPPRDQVFDDLRKELREGHAVPVLFGSAERGNGITPPAEGAAARGAGHRRHPRPARRGRGRPAAGACHEDDPHRPWRQALAVARAARPVQRGRDRHRLAGRERRASAACSGWSARPARGSRGAGRRRLAFGRMEGIPTGRQLRRGRTPPSAIASLAPPDPVFATAIATKDRKDDVRLNAALAKLAEEDPALIVEHRGERGTPALGQGEVHLRVVAGAPRQPLRRRGDAASRAIGYRETHPRQGGGARPPQEADRRPRPVRRRRHRGRAAAARLGLQVRGPDRRAEWCRANTSPPSSMACARR